ncbi:MAG: hypothetical protein K2I49_00240, partial [Ureaplasma sp.]|nr:hypothetical protein [Ureaplasma sp.]
NINIPSNTIQEIFWENSEDSVVNSKLVIKNLKFYNNILINNDNLNNLESNIQKYINENQLTVQQFESNNLGYSSGLFKEKIENYLGIKGLNAISKISFENNILTISPFDNYDYRNKFSSLNISNLINQNSEIQINLSNLKFFSDMRINNLAQLRSSIISYIVNSDRKLTIDEFEQYLTDNTKKAEIIQTIADNISVFANNTRSISVDKIKNINLVVNPENNQTRDLQIELDSDFVKYQLSESTNAGTLKDNILTVKNLEFYNAINIPTDKLNKLQNNIQNYINSPENKLLLDDFIKATNTEAFKKEVANYLGVTDTRLISSIFYNNDVLTITPLVDSVNNNRNKFTTLTASNLIDNGNIIVSGFNFFTLIQLTNTDNLASIINSIN